MSVFNIMEDIWSGNLKPCSSQQSSLGSESISSSSTVSTTPANSPRSTLPGTPSASKQAAVMAPNKQPPLRPVHRLSPLHSSNANHLLGAAKPALEVQHKGEGDLTRVLQLSKPLALGAQRLALEPQFRKPGSSMIPIPGVRSEEELERRTSLIKAVPWAPSGPISIRSQLSRNFNQPPARAADGATALAPPNGSWAKRQMHFPLNEPEKQPPGLVAPQKARKSAARARAAQQSTSIVARETTAEEMAWRFRFKKKWIREELFARKMEFPDDPGYEDEWEDARKLIETCGYGGALQAAFLELPAKSESNPDCREFEFESADSLLFEDEASSSDEEDSSSRSSSVCSEVAAKAAALVRLQRRVGTLHKAF